jgi:outer membrane protein assembly factor BamB
MAKKTLSFTWLIITVFLLTVLSLVAMFYVATDIFQKNKVAAENIQEESSFPARSIIEATLPVNEIWRISNINLPHLDIPAAMLASDDYVFFVSYDDGGKDSLNAIDSESGEILWTVNIPLIDSMIINESRIFIAVFWDIRSYNLSDGKLLWRSEQLPQHTGYRLHPIAEEKVLVYSVEDYSGKREQVLRYYNIDDGILETVRQEISLGEWLVLKFPDVEFWADRYDRFWAVSKPMNDFLWEANIDQQYNNTPTMMGSTIFLSDGAFPKLLAIDTNTGLQIWKYSEEIVSNIELSDGILYAVRLDGALTALDPNTGQEIGSIKFSPAETKPETKAYWIATAGEKIFVYFGDSRELIALSISKE